jgi:hypothetical protein
VLLAKEETVRQGMTDRMIETGRCYGMETKVEKTTAMRSSRQPSPVQVTEDQRQPENVKYFKYFV